MRTLSRAAQRHLEVRPSNAHGNTAEVGGFPASQRARPRPTERHRQAAERMRVGHGRALAGVAGRGR